MVEVGRFDVTAAPISLDECLRVRPRLVVISTVNGHGLVDGQRAVEALRIAGHPVERVD